MLYTIFNLNLDFLNNLPQENNDNLSFIYNNIELIQYQDFNYNLLQNNYNVNLYTNNDLLTSINATDNLINYNNDPMSIYTFSVPNMKIFYPEPFIATGNFSHTDLWFIHISIYQYWLWFFFIFLIIFFLLMFIVTLRWCNLRNKPQRETRGVSRSKCGDLITAAVPVTWAGSIIIHESTDAVDFYDGFGTSEMAVGVRAYQWGWEYYYPKDIDILYLTSNFNNEFVGNSLYYTKENDDFEGTIHFLEHHKIKNNFDAPITPAHLICFSTGFNDVLNVSSSKNFGYSKLIKDNTFKNTLSSRYINYNLNLNYLSYNNLFYKNHSFNKFLNMDVQVMATPQLHTKQHEYMSLSDLYTLHGSFYDMKSFNKYMELNSQIKTEKFINSKIHLFNNAGDLIYNILNNNINSVKFDKNNKDLYNFYKKFYKNVNAITFDSTKSDLVTLDKNFITLYIKENSFKVLNTIILMNKQVSLDNEYVNNNNILKIFPKNKILTDFIKLTNYDFIFNQADLNNINESHVRNFKNTQTIYGKSKTPFKDSYINVLLLNNYDQQFNLLNSLDNNDFYFANFILKFFKNNNKNYKFLTQVENILNLSNLSLFLYNLYGEAEDKRNPSFENFEDLIFSNLDDDYCVDLDYWYEVGMDVKLLEEDSKSYNLTNILGLEKIDTKEDDTDLNTYEFNSIKWYNLITKLNNIKNQNNFTLGWNTFIKSENIENNVIFNIINNLNINNTLFTNFNNLPTVYLNYLTNQQYVNSYLLNSFNNFKELTLFYNLINLNTTLNLNSFKLINEPQLLLTSYWNSNELNNILTNNYINMNKFNNTNFKFTFNYSLVDSIKTLCQTETALWRFYKSTFDDNKSFINFDNFSSSFNKLPFINTSTNVYKKYINKNYLSFIKSNLYIPKFNYLINSTNNLFLTTTLFTYNFPFSISTESDVLKYMWFDWYSNYNKRVAKQLDLSDYTINGVKVYKHKYDYNTNDVNKYNLKDNYLSRLSNSRKNYTPLWNYTPFILEMSKNWTKDYITFFNLYNFYDNMSGFDIKFKLLFWLRFMNWFDNLYININNLYLSQITLTNSGYLTPSRNFWRSVNTLSSYTYFMSTLVDILTKREYLFKQLLNYYNISVNNFKTYNVSPYNTIILNWKSNLLYNTNIEKLYIENFKLTEDMLKLNLYTLDLEYLYLKQFWLNNSVSVPLTKHTWFNNLITLISEFYFNDKICNELNNILDVLIFNQYKTAGIIDLKTSLINVASRLSNISNKCLVESNKISNNYKINNDKIFYKKTQYKHMRKSMANMIRIQNDKAVAMPVDTRIQFITVSKDIIHSWAIPSAGIKIDCIPGYSSHKITIFFLSGIYWGQCMEICGRYHHWMPIVVYFMKRDLFLLWCMHFVSSSKTMLTQTVNNNNDCNYVISYPMSSWKNELID